MKTATLLHLYLHEYAEKEVCSIRTVRGAVKVLTEKLGHLEHTRLSNNVINKYRAGEGLKPSTINRELGVLKAALAYNIGKERIRTMPPIPKPPAPKARISSLAPEEVERLLVAARMFACIHAYVRLALHTAQRMTAILQLRWAQVDRTRNVIWFGNHNLSHADRRKGRAEVWISPGLAKTLDELANDSPYVLATGTGMHYRDIVRHQWKRVVEAAGLPDLRPHDLRHTVATTLIAQGVPLIEVSRLLGHANTTVTEEVYAERRPEHLARAVAHCDQLLGL